MKQSIIWYHSQVVRPRSAKPLRPSSNLGGTSISSRSLSKRAGTFILQALNKSEVASMKDGKS